MTGAAIFGLQGKSLSKEERAFFKEFNPWGFILFARNIGSKDEIKALTDELRTCLGWECPILIDQEGGRVARLTAPDFREWLPPLEQSEKLPRADQYQAMSLRYRLIAHELRDVGIDANCAPMLDIPQSDTHPIITNRCYGTDVDTVSELGRAVAEGLLAGGVLPIIKHIPGHGRGATDSHLELPIVETDLETLSVTDFEPFRRLSDLPMAMTAHIVYPAIDPDFPATQSETVVTMIRDDFGFDGLLMTDDLSMKALDGTFKERVTKSLNAGCDIILHCNGDMAEMTMIADAAAEMSPKSQSRADATIAMRHDPDPFDVEWAASKLRAWGL